MSDFFFVFLTVFCNQHCLGCESFGLGWWTTAPELLCQVKLSCYCGWNIILKIVDRNFNHIVVSQQSRSFRSCEALFMMTTQVDGHIWWHFWRPSHQINPSSCPSGFQQGTFESSRTCIQDDLSHWMWSSFFDCRTLMMKGKRTALSLQAWPSWWASLTMTFSTDLIF